jgi:mono/diheme cytochrome c family protein
MTVDTSARPTRTVTTVTLPTVVPGGPNASPGMRMFAQHCAGCHGVRGEGGAGPSLTADSARKDLEAIVDFVKNPRPPMPKLYPTPLSEEDVRTVAAYVRTLQGAGKQ